MSFSGDVKKELAPVACERSCCMTAFAYGLFACAHAFSLADISLQTEHEAVAAAYAAALQTLFPDVIYTRRKLPRKGGYYIVDVDLPSDREKILHYFGHSGNEVALRLNRANFDCDACAFAYLRGAFLVCGTVTDPAVDYHLEFSLPYHRLCGDIRTLLLEYDFTPGLVMRKGAYVLYFKDSQQIPDLLVSLGAQQAALRMLHTKMVKNIRNNVNRQNNCENANTDKTASAAAPQLMAIDAIEKAGGLELLPEDLRELAKLRRDNPDFSLRDLGQMLDPPLTRSGVNHRLQRITAFAKGLK